MTAEDPAVADAPLPNTPAQTLLTALVAHYDDLVAHVQRRFGRRDMAHEVVHDAWLQLRGRGASREPVRTPLGLLRCILHDLAVDHMRAADARHAVVCPMDELPETACPLPALEQALAARQELARLAHAIETLPPRCRDVFILHKIHGLSQRDVADTLQISLKTVEKHLRLGMQACRRYLQEGA